MPLDRLAALLATYGLDFVEDRGFYAVYRGDAHVFNVEPYSTERHVRSLLNCIRATPV